MRIVYYHFAFLGDESLAAAMASECAGEQGSFWPYHHILYENQAGINDGAFSNDNLKGFADELGLDTDTFSSCLESEKYRQTVLEGRSLGVANGVNSTPTIFIDGVKVRGAASFEEVKPVIDQLLADISSETDG